MNQALQTIEKVMVDAKSALTSTIQQYQWELIPESQLHAAKAALTKSDYIMKIAAGDPMAVHDAMIKGGILGVDLTESKRQAYLLPRKNAAGKTVVVLQVGYKGVEAIHQRMGVIDRLIIRVVRENDEFDWSGDDAEKPTHNANWFDSDETRGKIIGAYSVTYFPDKSIHVMTAPISEIYEKHRDISDSWKQYAKKKEAGEWVFPSPWASHEKAMIEKTMAYIASKQWPANIRNAETSSKIIETLQEVDTADYTEAFVKYSPADKAIFDKLLEANDCLGMQLFSNTFGENIDSWAGLQNSFQRGEKVKGKTKVAEMCKIGFEMAENIYSALENDDANLFIENIDDCLKGTRGMLWKTLTPEQQEKATAFMSNS